LDHGHLFAEKIGFVKDTFALVEGAAAPGDILLSWWAHQDSNLEPKRYEHSALTIELWAPLWKNFVLPQSSVIKRATGQSTATQGL
jgi:hypothetical protein